MLKLRIILSTLLLIISVYMDGEITTQAQGIQLSKETVQIQGFSQYPNTTFYHVYAKSVRRIIVNRIASDVITIYPGSMQYIAWDTSLSELKHGIELSGEENPSILKYISLYRNDRKPQALEVPFYPPCRKVNQITSYIRISRQQGGGKEYGLNLYKRVYSAGTNQVTVTDKFHDMQVLLDKLTRQSEQAQKGVLTADEANSIRAYADSLKSRDVNSLYFFRKKSADNQVSEHNTDTHKPHGILQLQVTGFESISDGRFHLLIVGEDGLVCKRIRGNSVKLELNTDEDGYISRSQYWAREKKGVLFEFSSKQYKHFKANLHPKNRNEEPLVEIPTYQIKEEKSSEVYQFEAVSQLPELSKNKEDFVIKLKEPDGMEIVNLRSGFRTLSEGYNHSSRMPYIINFFAVLIMSLVIKYLVLLVLYKPLCQASGWDIKLKLFYTCLAATAITLSAVWFLVPFIRNFVSAKLIVSFAFTIVIEGMIYSKVLHIPLMKAILLSACCNLVFFTAGISL